MRSLPILRTAALALAVAVTAATSRAAQVAFAPGQPRADSRFTITPERPTPFTVIQFFDPFDRRQYSNDCVAERLNGRPRLVIDAQAHTIDLTLGPDRPVYCLDAVEPHSGLHGDFGRLAPGLWTYRTPLAQHTFTVVPEPATGLLWTGGGILIFGRRPTRRP